MDPTPTPSPENPERAPQALDISKSCFEGGLTRKLLDSAWREGSELGGVLEWEVCVRILPISEGLSRLSLSIVGIEQYSTQLNLESGEYRGGKLEPSDLALIRSALSTKLEVPSTLPELGIKPLLDPMMHYARSLQDPQRLHFAAHSHHLRPDCVEAANAECLHDSFTLLDHKWDKIFSKVWPKAQENIAARIGVDAPSQIVFAPNTHEFCARLLSCFGKSPGGVLLPVTVVTTDSEFHSFSRQLARFAENPLVNVIKVPLEPFGDFEERFRQAVSQPDIDLVFFSQVFYNCGYVVQDLEKLVRAVPSAQTSIVVDGYHAFGAMPVDLSAIQDRIFYTAGGYKYAQYGEGGAFLYVPPNCTLRPENTGWFAQFGNLSRSQPGNVKYPDDGMRFVGSTLDPAALYRLNHVSDWMKQNQISDMVVHRYVKALQALFIDELDQRNLWELNSHNLIMGGDTSKLGNFLTFKLDIAGEIQKRLAEEGIIVDSRGDRLRFGFGVYHTPRDIIRLVERLASTKL